MMDRIDLPTPADEDPVVHRFLSTLPRFQPAPAFDVRVLTRVWRPAPRAWRRLAGSWQTKMFVGLLAAGAFVWQLALVGFVRENPGVVQDAWGLVRDRGLPLAQQWVAAWTAEAAPFRALAALLAPWWWLVALGSVVVLLSTVGFVWVLRSGRHSHAAR